MLTGQEVRVARRDGSADDGQGEGLPRGAAAAKAWGFGPVTLRETRHQLLRGARGTTGGRGRGARESRDRYVSTPRDPRSRRHRPNDDLNLWRSMRQRRETEH